MTPTNTYYGVYAVDTFDITDRLAATLGGRVNVATLSVQDQLGTSPDLNSDATRSRWVMTRAGRAGRSCPLARAAWAGGACVAKRQSREAYAGKRLCGSS